MRRSDRAMSRTLDDEVVILDVPSGRYFSLSAVGALVWERLENDTTLEELIDAVTAEFAVDAGTAQSDITDLLDSLEAEGLLVE